VGDIITFALPAGETPSVCWPNLRAFSHFKSPERITSSAIRPAFNKFRNKTQQHSGEEREKSNKILMKFQTLGRVERQTAQAGTKPSTGPPTRTPPTWMAPGEPFFVALVVLTKHAPSRWVLGAGGEIDAVGGHFRWAMGRWIGRDRTRPCFRTSVRCLARRKTDEQL